MSIITITVRHLNWNDDKIPEYAMHHDDVHFIIGEKI